MAGGMGFKQNPKNKNAAKNSGGNEVIKDYQANYPSIKKNPGLLGGILSLGQTIEIGSQKKEPENWSKEFLGQINHLVHQEKVLLDHRQIELQKNIEELRLEVSKLIKSTENLDKEIEKVSVVEIVEANTYQIGFVQRIKNLIINFRKNISEAGVWLDALTHKKSKRKAFWNNVKNKKNGGEQYLFSGEHSASRSAS